MKSNTETLLDDNGFELLVAYDYEETPATVEDFHGPQIVGPYIYTELKSVEFVIGSTKGIELLPLLNEVQKVELIRKLQYD